MIDARERLARRHGGAAFDAWWDALPRLTEELAQRWNLALGEPIPRGNTSLLLRCTRDGRAGVLKLSPEAALAADEARALRAWEPTGRVPAVWEHDGGALLLDAIVPGIAAERASLDEVAALLTDLHSAPPDGFPPLTERVEFVFDLWIPRCKGVARADRDMR